MLRLVNILLPFSAFVCLLVPSVASGQEPDFRPPHDSTLMERFEHEYGRSSGGARNELIVLPDLPPTLEQLAMGYVRYAVPYSSLVILPKLPDHVKVIPDGFRLSRSWSVGISNGQASNWGEFPNAYLDARTLSFPATGRGGAPRR